MGRAGPAVVRRPGKPCALLRLDPASPGTLERVSGAISSTGRVAPLLYRILATTACPRRAQVQQDVPNVVPQAVFKELALTFLKACRAEY